MSATARRLLLAIACTLIAGCANVGYYVRSMQGQLDIFRRERPIPELVASVQTPAPLREKLETALSIRAFASQALALPDNDSYRRYADIQRPFAVYNVFATPEFSLAPLEWCFPFAGCVKYRGYFSLEEAQRYAAEMTQRGHDVFIGGVPAYSTLGWFADPVLNTFVNYPRPELARLIFHELAHQVAYVRDDSMFNESFAVTVEREGVRRWLDHEGTAQDRQIYERVQERRRAFTKLVQQHRNTLEALYASDLPAEEKRARKKAVLAELDSAYEALRTTWGVVGGADRWFGQRPNNALLASVSIYTQLVPSFEALLRRRGGDLKAFYADVKALAALPPPERSAQLEALNVQAAAHP
ncbi:MAG TPA: aminopeptidase [Burkholderiales bacterium]|nr:aminopeptidase [Burkholderiales bacterium]